MLARDEADRLVLCLVVRARFNILKRLLPLFLSFSFCPHASATRCYSLWFTTMNTGSSDIWDMSMCSLFEYASSSPVARRQVRQHILNACHLLDLKPFTQPSLSLYLSFQFSKCLAYLLFFQLDSLATSITRPAPCPCMSLWTIVRDALCSFVQQLMLFVVR